MLDVDRDGEISTEVIRYMMTSAGSKCGLRPRRTAPPHDTAARQHAALRAACMLQHHAAGRPPTPQAPCPPLH
eukprot:294272-Prymnesium_polylepis.1